MNPTNSLSFSLPRRVNYSFDEGGPLPPPSVPDLRVCRSIPDSALARGRHQPQRYCNRNTTYMMINRSGGADVKRMMATIRQSCSVQEPSRSSVASVTADSIAAVPPEQECCILAQWAADSYYRVVIAKNGGIPTIVQTMKAFPLNHVLQECCCLLLTYLCLNNAGALMKLEGAEGVAQIILAMKNHPRSVAVQSAACDALHNMAGPVLANAIRDSTALLPDLVAALYHARQMNLHPKHKSTASKLVTIIMANTSNVN
jgi:hypothetical protein